MTSFNIVVYSDSTCPWCYIGLKKLNKAISLFQKTYPGGSADDFQLSWKPYFLDRNPPKESLPVMERMNNKLGPARAAVARERVTRIGLEEGIPFTFNGRIGDTKPSHILMHLASSKGGSKLQNATAESIFRAQFEEDKDISKTDTLVEIGERAGLAEKDIREALNDQSQLKAIIQEEENGRTKEQINGVPHYVINGKVVVGGAAAESEWLEVFDSIKKGEI